MPKFNVSSNDEVVKLDHRTHVYKLPDTYIGSTENTKDRQYFRNEETNIFDMKDIDYIPGEYKIFDEIAVNAMDQYIRTHENSKCSDKVTKIELTTNKETGEICVKNDGEGIEIKKNSKEKVYNPELIFGHLLTSTNYNEKTLKHVGGKNGYGAKLTNIFSKRFYIETCDGKNIYKQTFHDNMTRKDDPIIKKSTKNQYTLIKYIPDYAKFKIDGLSDTMIKIMEKRAYDIAAFAIDASIYFNNSKINIKSFKDYVEMYIEDKETKVIHQKINNRWEVSICLNDNQTFEAISFVNGINTSKGGKHVDYIVNQITKKLSEFITKKKKLNIKPQFIKDNIKIFIKCTIDNPSFSSQTKEFMSTNKDKFGSECIIDDKLINQIAKIGIIERAIELYEFKTSKGLKKNDGKKQNRLKGVPKLEDANWAGTKKSDQCTLILTEGDSAKSMAMAGMSIIGRDKYGVFPLKGKILNVKDNVNGKKIAENIEISNIKKIMGLVSNKEYEDTKSLRYGKLLILTDQDEDGSHIKGLIFNLFQSLWPSLYKYPGFLNTMLTPVIKAKLKSKEKSFYSVKDYDKWVSLADNSKWSIKYYKGLGTSTPKEAKEYFKAQKMVNYTSINVNDTDAIELAFSKNDDSANKRKSWLAGHDVKNTLDYTSKTVSINDFINLELIHFSAGDNIRSVPNIIDGLKPSQRKVLYCCKKRNLISKEIRVAQLAGYISEHAAYHHGEMSLHGTIVNMAQDHIGSNNINLLEPVGQFGTRIMGGKDSAQPRYIHTKLMSITELLFNKLDEPLYKYNTDDGLSIEPIYYAPIIPMALVNGSQGIGTGWSTDIPKFNPLDLIENIKLKLNNEEYREMKPYVYGFKGTIEKKTNQTYISKGIYEIKEGRIIITELPIGMWTDVYKTFLESLVIDTKNKSKKQIIRYYNSYCSDTEVKFEIIMNDDELWDLNKYNEKLGMTQLEKTFKLVSQINLTNIVAFDAQNKITKYNSVNTILDEYVDLRLNLYEKRKTYLLDKLQNEIDTLSIKIRFIEEFINHKIIINNKSKANIIEQLEKGKYPKENDSYDYLLKMPIYNLTKDKIDEFNTNLNGKESEYKKLNSKNNKQLWLDDLNILEPKLNKFKIINKFKFKVKTSK